MKRIIVNIFVLALTLAQGCGKSADTSPAAPSSSGATLSVPAGAAVKIVSQPALSEGLIGWSEPPGAGASIGTDGAIRFFESLSVDKSAADRHLENGALDLAKLDPSLVIVALAGGQLRAGTVGDLRDRRQALDAIAAALAHPSLRTGLIARVREELERNNPTGARKLADLVKDDALSQEVAQAEALAALDEAHAASEKGEIDAALALVQKAETLHPGLDQTLTVRHQILEKHGGELRTFDGHAASVTCVAISADGLAASSSGDGTIKVWDVLKGRELRTLPGHRGRVTSVAFSPDGKLLASTGDDGTVRLWEADTGAALATSESLGFKERTVGFAPDGFHVASGGDDSQLKIWKLKGKLRERQVVRGHGWKVTSVAYSPDGKKLLSGSEDDSAMIWEVSTGAAVHTFRCSSSDVLGVAWSGDGQQIATGSADGRCVIWNVATGRELRRLDQPKIGVAAVVFTVDGRHLLAGGRDGGVTLWQVASGAKIRRFNGHKDTISHLAVTPDGEHFLSSSADGTVKYWQLPHAAWPTE